MGTGDADTPSAEPDLGADLEELESDRAACGETGSGKCDTPQGGEQDIGHGGEPEAKLVGAHGGGAVSEEVELALLDTVLHLASGAVEPFVEDPPVDGGEVTMKRGLALRGSHSALPTTRRGRDQVFSVL